MAEFASPAMLTIGWAQEDITPTEPVLIAGQFYARRSEGVADPLTATALALESGGDHAVLVCCDLVCIGNELRDRVRQQFQERAQQLPGLDPMKVVINATHTHSAPEIRALGDDPFFSPGVELDAMKVEDFQAFAAKRIAEAVAKAWAARATGGIAYGSGFAVLGRNRRWIDDAGRATMYGKTNVPTFNHIEGYEDHSLGLMAIYDDKKKLTGLVVNVPCTSQVSEHEYTISADFWHETRAELRRRFGAGIFILPQCSAAGDQAPRPIYDKPAEQRMLRLKGRTERAEIAQRIAHAVAEILPFIEKEATTTPRLRHRVEHLAVPLTKLSPADVQTANAEAEQCRLAYEAELRKFEQNPALREEPRWYKKVTESYRRMRWLMGVGERFELQKTQPTMDIEMHVLAIGDVALVTIPFEYYLDFGIMIKARSPATQTFIVQLAGQGSYCPSTRSVAAAGYGSVPASNPTGPEAGRLIAERAIGWIEEVLAR